MRSPSRHTVKHNRCEARRLGACRVSDLATTSASQTIMRLDSSNLGFQDPVDHEVRAAYPGLNLLGYEKPTMPLPAAPLGLRSGP